MKRRKFIQIGASTPFLTLPAAYAFKERENLKNVIQEPARSTTIAGDYDVIVSGAGPDGVSAAIEAGRTGAKTLLIEAHGRLGGVWTAGLLTRILDQKNKQVLKLAFDVFSI